MSTALFLLRAAQIGLSMADLELLELGMVYDMITERNNDDFDYPIIGTVDDFLKL